MRPLYDARLEDLGPLDMIKITCPACSHITRLPRTYFERYARAEPYQPVLSLKRRLGCKRCRTRGYIDISIEWGS